MPVGRLIWAVCAAQSVAQLGAFAVPALLPTFIDLWRLSNTEAGWLTGIYYAGYTLSVPVLVSLTDRIDPKRIYLAATALTTFAMLGYGWLADGFWSALFFRTLMGVGWAGTYMPGLKALSDWVEGPRQSRAVAAHAAAVGISGALSFAVAGIVAAALGWRAALAVGGLGAGLALLIMALMLPARAPRPRAPGDAALLDFRPVLANRSALAYSLGYMVHTWEMSALRGWVVTFLTYVAARGGDSLLIAPTLVASLIGLFGTGASVVGNECARRLGRRRLIFWVMAASIVMAALIGFTAALPYWVVTLLAFVYAGLIWADSASLTAGSTGSAKPDQRGATLAVHTTLGYLGGFFGPLLFGVVLDLAGGESLLGWGLAFGHLALVLLVGPLALILLNPADLPGDRPARSVRGR